MRFTESKAKTSMNRTPAGRKAQRSRQAPPPRRQWWPWILSGIAVLTLIVVGIALTRRTPSGPALSAADVATFGNVPSGHQDGPLTFEQIPPVGGIHNATWLTCGSYKQPLANEYAVHSMEHGAVSITYRPDLPADAVERLENLASGRSHMLVSPYPDLPAPLVASAWGVQMKVDSADDPQLEQFMAKYLQGPQTPEPGAPCRGGNNFPR